MRLKLLTLIIFLFLTCESSGFKNECFLLSKNGTLLIKEGNCDLRYSPCSTFKIALSLMGYDSRILFNEREPSWPFLKGYSDWLTIWKKPHDPKNWIRNSCVWYSQVLTRKMGLQKFRSYLERFGYGNQDVSGDFGKNNGLTNCWLSSSLKISPVGQLNFLNKLIQGSLPVTKNAHQYTKKLLFSEKLDGWDLFSKTGAGFLLKPDGSLNKERQFGWFVGWLQKGSHYIIFVSYAEDTQKMPTSVTTRLKKILKKKILEFLE